MRKIVTGWMLLAAMLLVAGLTGCEGDQGPQGPAGTASCMNCHTDQYDDELAILLAPFQAEFEESKHNTGETFLRRGDDITPECSRCHTNEGHQHYVNTGEAIAVEFSSKIGCFTCHAPHTNENFSIRQQSAVVVNQGGTYDRGTSNECAVCHQVRNPRPGFNDGEIVQSPYWGPHHGPQANILTGQGAYEFGQGTYPSEAAHKNAISNGCVTCHMASVPENALAGGHTYKIVYNYRGSERVNIPGCTCHNFGSATDGTTFTRDFQSPFTEDLEGLRDDLIALGWIDDQDHIVPGQQRTADELGAIWNYLILLEDQSYGVHNPTYTEAVLERTVNFVNGQGGIAGLTDTQTMKSDR